MAILKIIRPEILRDRTSVALMLSACVCLAIGAMEWLFFYTKPSFMDSIALSSLITTALLPAFWLFVCSSVAVLFLSGLHAIPFLPRNISLAVPAFLSGCFLIIAWDNFFYTIFNIGIITTRGLSKYVITALLFFFMVLAFRFLVRKSDDLQKSPRPLIFIATSGLMVSGLLLSGHMGLAGWRGYQVTITPQSDAPQRRPNIIFFAADGVEALISSAYGYEFETTPALKKMATRSLVFSNAFSPSGRSTGSTTSMLSGKHPFRTKVGFPPQILTDQNSFQHLPAVLRKLGYVGYQAGLRYYIDGGDLNMRRSFDVANGRPIWNPAPTSFVGNLTYTFNNELYFFNRVLERYTRRLQHLLGIKDMFNHFLLVSQDIGLNWNVDRNAVTGLIDFARTTTQPFFAHIHLMGTHCCNHNGAKATVIKELPDQTTKQGAQKNAIRRYANSVRDSDDHMSFLLAKLSELGKLENTIVVVSSDHSRGWSSLKRVPLVISFPKNAHADIRHENVQLVDLAPTLLTYMGIKTPGWMDGRDLLTATGRKPAPLLSLETIETAQTQFFFKSTRLSLLNNPGPPKYGLYDVGVIVCDVGKRITLDTGEVTTHKIPGHTRPCAASDIPDDQWILNHVADFLSKHKFESGLQARVRTLRRKSQPCSSGPRNSGNLDLPGGQCKY